MTAIVRTFTRQGLRQGFVIAADGRQANAHTYAVESDEVQKIFPIKTAVGVFAISFSGFPGLESVENGELNFPRLVVRCAKSLEHRKCSNAVGYAHRLSRCAREAVLEFCSGMPINSNGVAQPNMPGEIGETLFRLGLDGFEESGRPASIDMRFYHVAGKLREPEVKLNNPIYVGISRADAPCATIAELVLGFESDRRLAAFRCPKKPPSEVTLQDAIERSKAFIAAHSDPEALAIDRDCHLVGGHIHIATITLADGFKWEIAPKNAAIG